MRQAYGSLRMPRRPLLKGLGAAVLAGGSVFNELGRQAFAQEQPRRGGVVNLPLPGDPEFNPIIAPAQPASFTCAMMYDGLTKPDVTGKPVPNLAQSWDLSADGRTYTFHLKPDVMWHDGRPFVADDVKFTMDLIKNPKTNTILRGNYEPLEQVEVVDPRTVRFHLSRPYVTLVSWLYWYTGIVPKHLLEGKDVNTYAEFNIRHPIGTGPFKFKDYRPSEYVILERNDQYHRGRPYLDQIVIKIVPNANTRVANLLSGGLNFIFNVPPQAVSTIQGHPNTEVVFRDIQRYDFYAPNQNQPMFQDKRVRQALAYGLSRKALFDVTTLGHGVLAFGPISPALGSYYDTSLKPKPFDPARAKTLLKEAGWVDTKGNGVVEKDLGDGKLTPFRWKLSYIQGDSSNAAEAAIAKENWKAIGADVILDPLEYGQFQTLEEDFKHDMVRDAWNTLPDPDLFNFLSSSATGKNGNNYAAWKNPEADRLLAEGQRESDPAKRRAIYWKFQELCYEEEPEIFLFHPKEIDAKSKQLQGMLPANFRINLHWTHLYWMKP